MPDEEFLMWVCQKGKHNKFWTYEIDGNTVTTRYGRLGLKGQSTAKKLRSSFEATRFARDKRWEKERKGYRQVKEEEFNLLRLQADILGTGNKTEGVYIVKDSPRKKTLTELPPEALYDPNLKPSILLIVRLRGKDGATDPIHLLFTTPEKCSVLESCWMRTNDMRPILIYADHRSWVYRDKSSVDNYPKLAKLMEKAQEVVGTIL
jgi:predicted DNA-binding WGR domain protein